MIFFALFARDPCGILIGRIKGEVSYATFNQALAPNSCHMVFICSRPRSRGGHRLAGSEIRQSHLSCGTARWFLQWICVRLATRASADSGPGRKGGSQLVCISAGFHLLRDPKRRKENAQSFYAAIGNCPDQVFPVRFHSDSGYFDGIISETIGGFYSFPLDKQSEIERFVSPAEFSYCNPSCSFRLPQDSRCPWPKKSSQPVVDFASVKAHAIHKDQQAANQDRANLHSKALRSINFQ